MSRSSSIFLHLTYTLKIGCIILLLTQAPFFNLLQKLISHQLNCRYLGLLLEIIVTASTSASFEKL